MREKEETQVSELGNSVDGSGWDWELQVKNEDNGNMNWNLGKQPWAPRAGGTLVCSILPPQVSFFFL